VAQRYKPDLMIMGVQGHSSLGNLVMGLGAKQVLACAAVQALFVR